MCQSVVTERSGCGSTLKLQNMAMILSPSQAQILPFLAHWSQGAQEAFSFSVAEIPFSSPLGRESSEKLCSCLPPALSLSGF